MGKPVININYKPKEKGAKSTRIISIWRNSNDNGEWLSGTPKMEADDYGPGILECLAQYAKGEGYLNVYVNETVEPAEDF